jgi:hypothetical protein
LAQAALKERYGIETSDVKVKEIPESIRQEYVTKYGDAKDLKIRIPLHAAFRLLKECGDELAEDFFRLYDKEIKTLLETRNKSILAHGFNPVNEEIFKRLLESILKFSKTNEEDLPKFPVLQI